MVRNEIDIVAPFLCHLAAIFDHAVILDHGSVDGTGEMVAAACEARPGWRLWRTDISGNHQALFSNFGEQHLMAETDADFVFFLDADEFLDFPTRDALVQALHAIPDGSLAGQVTWADCIPERTDIPYLRHGDPIWCRTADTPYRKIILPRRLHEAAAGAIRPSVGAHSLVAENLSFGYHPLGTLLHVPLRSVAQLRQKIMAGTLSTLGRPDRQERENFHWFTMLDRLAKSSLTESDFINIAKDYGREVEDWTTLDIDDLAKFGFHRRGLDVASWPLPLPAPALSDPWRVLANLLCHWRSEESAGIELVLDGDSLQRKKKKTFVRGAGAPG